MNNLGMLEKSQNPCIFKFLPLELGNRYPDSCDLLRRNVGLYGSRVADSIVSYTRCSGPEMVYKVALPPEYPLLASAGRTINLSI